MPIILLSTPWFRFCFPLLLVITSWFVGSTTFVVTSSNQDVFEHLPYVLFIVTIIIAHIFKQSRIGMVASALLVAYYIIRIRLQVPLSMDTTLLELSLLSLLMPVACILTYLFKDSGLLNRGYFTYLGLLGLFCLWSILIVDYSTEGGFNTLAHGVLTPIPSISRLPFILTLYLFAIIGITAIYVLNKNRIVDTVVYTSILMSSSTFILFHIPHISSILFTICGVLLIVYLIKAGQQMAFNDRLTNLPGRRALEIDLKHVGRNFSIAMLDVDHFKKFNDTYGHDTGDDVLKLVASRINKVKGKAKAYRYGGEEFTIIFKGKTALEAKKHLDELRQDIADYDMTLRNEDTRPKNNKLGVLKRKRAVKSEKVNVTISIGVSDNQSSKKANEVIKYADDALYKAKKAGRNRVEINQIYLN
jgi:diguanylate cyclase (GGDEF)-like protein